MRRVHTLFQTIQVLVIRWWKIILPVVAIALIAIPITFISFFYAPPKQTNAPPDKPDEEQVISDDETAPPDPTLAPAPPPPPPAPPKAPPPPTPSSVLGLTNWKLTLPVDTAHAGSPDEITQPELASFSNAYFFLNSAKNGVIFHAPVGGATTAHSDYPRSELREMTNSGKTEASWSNTSGTHIMTIRQAITHTPSTKPDVVAGQIHDSSDDVIEIRLFGSRLYVEADGDDLGPLDEGYVLGTTFTVKVEASGGHIKVYYNGDLKIDYDQSGSGWYFKAGCYTQSNPDKGDSPDDYGEVIIYSLQVTHV